jgi:glycosyltransferase involved in cell wall biosynthesis
MKEKAVSILIRTKNEEQSIGQTLSSLLSQTFKNIEILIVDSGSSDRTLELARKFPVRIYEISPDQFTWGFALNFGFQRTKCEYVVCLSAHALPLADTWLEVLIANFSDGNVAAVMSKNLPFPDCNPFDRRGLLNKFNIRKQEITGGPPYVFGNYSSVIRRSVWQKIHFDETLSYAEDQDWAQKVINEGYKIIYEPEAEVYHSHNETLKQIHRRTYCEAYACKTLKFQKYTLFSIIFDIVAGSLYDMLYVVYKRDGIKWFFFAPLRRLAKNYGRLKARGEVKKIPNING